MSGAHGDELPPPFARWSNDVIAIGLEGHEAIIHTSLGAAGMMRIPTVRGRPAHDHRRRRIPGELRQALQAIKASR
jgi:hypothetical protein